MSNLGWSYPAGAENDPFAPYNQDFDDETDEVDEVDEVERLEAEIERLKAEQEARDEELALLQVELAELRGWTGKLVKRAQRMTMVMGMWANDDRL